MNEHRYQLELIEEEIAFLWNMIRRISISLGDDSAVETVRVGVSIRMRLQSIIQEIQKQKGIIEGAEKA